MAEEIITHPNGAVVRFKRGIGKPGKSRLIAPGYLWDQLSLQERENVAGSGSNKCKAFMWTLSLCATMKRSEARNMLQRLEDNAFIDAGRTQDIMDALK